MIIKDVAHGVHNHDLGSNDVRHRVEQPGDGRVAAAGETFGGCGKSCAELFCSSSCVKSYWHGGTHLCNNGHHYT